MLYTIGSNDSIRNEDSKKKSKRHPKRDTSKVSKIKDTVVEVELVSGMSNDIFSDEFTESFTDIISFNDSNAKEIETPSKAKVKKTSDLKSSSKGKKRQSSKSLNSKQSSEVSNASLLDSNYVDIVTTRKKKTENNIVDSIKLPKVSKAEKVAYCNSVYGEGNWVFMTYDEVRTELFRSLL